MPAKLKPELLQPQDWPFPVPVAYGPGRLAEIAEHCTRLGIANPLIVTDRGSAALPFISALADRLSAAGIGHGLFAGVSPNPRDDEIGAGCTAYREGRHDALIAIGGGSAMDGAKAIGLTARSRVGLWQFEFEQASPCLEPAAFPALITIPTTAGTGAETESTAMVTDVAKGMKFCVWHPRYKPALALLDPELTLGLPPDLTAWTGVDALTHAIEAYCVPGFHPFCDGLALEGLALVSNSLAAAVREPGNLSARAGMLTGSCLAGVAFLKGLGLVHAISHMIGAEYDTHHGLTNAIVLPVVLRYNLPGMENKVVRMAQAMQLPDYSVDGFIGEIERLLDEIGIPKSLEAIGVPRDCASRIAEKAIADSAAATNPRPATVAEIAALTHQAIVAAR